MVGIDFSLLLNIASAALAIGVVFVSYRVFAFFINTDLAYPLEIVGLGFLVFTIHEELIVLEKMGVLSIPWAAEATNLLFMAVVLFGVYRFRKAFFVYNWLKGIDVRDLTNEQVEDLRWLVKIYTDVKRAEKKLERQDFFEKLGIKSTPKEKESGKGAGK